MPGLDLNEPINWDEIEEFEGDVHDLSYDYVWDSGNGGNHLEFSFSICFHCTSYVFNDNDTTDDDDDEGEDGQDEGDHNTVDGDDEAVYGDVVVEPEAGSGAHILQQVEGESVQQVEEADVVPQADAGDEADAVAFDSGTPSHANHVLFSNEPKLSACKP